MNTISNREISLSATIAGIKAATSEQLKFLSTERDVALKPSSAVQPTSAMHLDPSWKLLTLLSTFWRKMRLKHLCK
jgi:hypothetical protein